MAITLAQQASRFAIIGAIGFVVDGGILMLLHHGFAVSVLHARLVSFAVAVTLTWFLNRRHTFSASRDNRRVGEWSRYAAVNGIGALLNLGLFLWLVYRVEALADWPIIALAIAAGVALVFNFFASRRLAFRQHVT